MRWWMLDALTLFHRSWEAKLNVNHSSGSVRRADGPHREPYRYGFLRAARKRGSKHRLATILASRAIFTVQPNESGKHSILYGSLSCAALLPVFDGRPLQTELLEKHHLRVFTGGTAVPVWKAGPASDHHMTVSREPITRNLVACMFEEAPRAINVPFSQAVIHTSNS